MKIYGARYDRGELHIKCDPPDGIKFAMTFKEGDYEILPQKKEKKRRSLDANAYSWVLINKIAERLGIPPDDVYRNAIKDLGTAAEEPEVVPLDELHEYVGKWVQNHLGRQVRFFPAENEWYMNVIRIHGSSDFDTKQMARFIDGLIQDAQALDIETRDPRWVQSLIDSWEAKR